MQRLLDGYCRLLEFIIASCLAVMVVPVFGKNICRIAGQGLMLYITWLIFSGSLAQTRINRNVEAPVFGASTTTARWAPSSAASATVPPTSRVTTIRSPARTRRSTSPA
jgi:TRAP-type C4-dicarboxylate transport system permease small subunit